MPKDIFVRSSGILLHPTSLPGPHGIGDLGPAAFQFIDDLHEAGQRWWQMLPVTPPGYGDSPYNSLSAFAGNPLLISLERLAEVGWLEPGDVGPDPQLPEGNVDFGRVKQFKEPLLRKAFSRFMITPRASSQLEMFRRKNMDWLEGWSLFVALKERAQGRHWLEWAEELRLGKKEALDLVRVEVKVEINYQVFLQYVFRRQWDALRRYAKKKNVQLLGDIPIFVAHDSADVWEHRDLFKLDPAGQLTVVAGVPPDYFSNTGQRWGNPVYNWEVHNKNNFSWWISRIGNALKLFDAVRLDHFIGFYRCWEIPASEATAVKGAWNDGPRAALFEAVIKALKKPAIVAEDLGNVIPPVHRLRTKFNFPGMFVLHFAFGDGVDKSRRRIANVKPRTVVYTGTHDNDTTVGWFREQGGGTNDPKPELRTALEILKSDGQEINWQMIRLALSSKGELAIVPVQDLLGLDSSARMNRPGTSQGNWGWRLRLGQLDFEIKERFKGLTEHYERL